MSHDQYSNAQLGKASFVYDGDGHRGKATFNGTTTVYVGDYYEKTGGKENDERRTMNAEQAVAQRSSFRIHRLALAFSAGQPAGAEPVRLRAEQSAAVCGPDGASERG